MRSVFVPWSVALREGERLLDDLSRYTKLDCVELLDFSSQIERASYDAPARPASRVLPPSKGFDLDLPVVKREELKGALKFMTSAKSRGFKIVCDFVPLWLGSNRLRKAAMTDVTGRRLSGPGDFPVYGCPNHPDIVRYGQYMVGQFAREWPDMDIVTFNHLEYPHILLWTYPKVDLESMFACFCPACEKTALERGLDLDRMKNWAKLLLASMSHGASTRKSGPPPAVNADDVVNYFLRWPFLAQWLMFRMDSVTTYTRSVLAAGREAAREFNPKLQFGLQFQLPSLSQLLGTDFLTLSYELDLMLPKFFDYLPGSVIPLFAREVSSRTGLDEAALLRTIRDAFDLGPGPTTYAKVPGYPKISDLVLYTNSFDYSMVGRQMKYLRPLRGTVPVYPYFLEPNRDKAGLRRKVEAAANEGFNDFFLWSWEGGLTTEHLRSLKGLL